MISYEDKDLCLYDENNTIVLHKNIHFIQPTKNKYGKYISKINNILYFKLPTIDEKDIIEDRDNNDLILKLDSENYYKIKKILLHGMGMTKSDIKYLKESILVIKRMNFEKFKELWNKVQNKVGSPYIKKDIYDLISFHERHK